MKQYSGILIAFGALVALGAGAVALLTRQYWVALGMLGAGLVFLLVSALVLRGIAKRQQERMDRVFRENDSAVASLIQNISIPCAILDLSGRITWRNSAFSTLFDGQNVREIAPEFDGEHPIRSLQVEYNGSNYQVMNMLVQRKDEKKLVLQYWLDRTEAAHYQRLYTEQRPYVAMIFVDNY